MRNYQNFFFAKQPVLDINLSTYGYELLFRSSLDTTSATITDPDAATISMLTGGFIRSQQDITKSQRIFINFTERLLLEGAPRVLPSSAIVIEVLETTTWSSALFDELLKYKQEGYLIAIDDFTGNNPNSAYIDIADFIKLDVLAIHEKDIADIFEKIANKNALKVAEKVEDGGLFRKLRNFDFDLFQGYFFSRPENYSGKKIGSMQVSRLKLLAELQQENIETEHIISIITADPGLAFRLLSFLNSAAFGFSMKIESIRHAVVLLGITRLKYWLQLVVLSDINDDDGRFPPKELFQQALARGRVLEELTVDGCINKYRPESIFLFGLFSLLDVMLDMPFTEIFSNLPLPSTFTSAYMGEESSMTGYLQLLQALENGDIPRVTTLCDQCGLTPQSVADCSIRAHTWADSIIGEIL